MTQYIYSLSCPVTNDIKYIGKTIDPVCRLKKHIRSSRLDPRTKKECWIKSLFVDGLVPILSIIEECTDLNVNEREIYWIKYYRDSGVNLKNLTDGGDGLNNPSKSTRDKLADAARGKHPSPDAIERLRIAVNKAWSNPELREKQSLKFKGKKQSAEAIAARVNSRINNGTYTMSDSNREKLRQSKIGKRAYNKVDISVIQYGVSGNLIKIWDSHHDAAKEFSGEPKNILKCCRGIFKTCKGYKWKFYEDI